jgi:hypothetical protein
VSLFPVLGRRAFVRLGAFAAAASSTLAHKMAWRSHGTSSDTLTDALVRHSILTSPRAIDAFRTVDRADFVQDKSEAYMDSPQCVFPSFLLLVLV